MISVQQEREFREYMLDSAPIERALEWLMENIDLEDRTIEGELIEWAMTNGDKHLSPDEVFLPEQLATWAINNGWTRTGK
jgi:hypothetical protein